MKKLFGIALVFALILFSSCSSGGSGSSDFYCDIEYGKIEAEKFQKLEIPEGDYEIPYSEMISLKYKLRINTTSGTHKAFYVLAQDLKNALLDKGSYTSSYLNAALDIVEEDGIWLDFYTTSDGDVLWFYVEKS